MAQLIVRNIDENLKLKLQMIAKSKGRSMEEEVRQIISKSLSENESKAGDLIASHFKDIGLVEGELQPLERGQEIRFADFENDNY